ncbi:RNA-binding protein 39 isoform B [Glycine soja]|uniref:RNA-binding protein 39 isoform B n=1 Tax=Glycine soja TaxID=3848 RepID=A0A445F3D2_GLYSO|nr:RNA-binding protein 39 isoform B [Glycine soja]
MDFDEYEYLEKAVENPEVNHRANGGDKNVKSEERGRNGSSKHKDDDDDDVVDLHPRHSKSGDNSRDRERQRERGSTLHGSKSRDGDKDRNSGGSRDRRRDRDRDHENKDRKRDKERDHGDKDMKRDRERDRDRNRDQERDRRDRGSEAEQEQRSRSRSDRLRTDLDDKDREASRDREYRDRERSRDKDYKDRERVRESREHDRENRNAGGGVMGLCLREAIHLLMPVAKNNVHLGMLVTVSVTVCNRLVRHKEKKEETTEPADPERDQRAVFAYQISLKADERDVFEFFSRAGKVRDVRLIMDRNSRRSKGVGYIEFYDVMSVPMAIALSGQPLLGQPVMVKPSEAEKNLVQSTTSVANGLTGLIGPYSGGARKLYVGNLHISITEADIRRVFEAFGQVELVQLPLDESGHCKGFGFVQFARLEDARNAQSLNGQLEIGGRTIKVSAVTDQSGMQEFGGNTGDFDDDEGGGMSLNACSRAMLMQKLDRSGTASSMVGSLGNSVVNNTGLNLPATGNILAAAPVGELAGGGLQIPTATIPSIDTIGVASECLMLKNMFDPKDEIEPDFDLDIKEDVEAECSKLGTLKHIYVDKKSAGFVYLRFEDTQSAISAQQALHGRWFAGKMITASFMVPQSYEDKFPDSR